MAYAWTTVVSVGNTIKTTFVTDVNTAYTYIQGHCPANHASNKSYNSSYRGDNGDDSDKSDNGNDNTMFA